MKFRPIELESVLEIWQDISQDPKIISDETGIEVDRVKDILSSLQSDGQIEDYVSEGILLFEEFEIDDETSSKLKLSQFTKGGDKNYFFKKIEGGDIFDDHIFQVVVKSVDSYPDSIYFDLIVKYKFVEYPIMMTYQSSEDVFYSIPEDRELFLKFKEIVGQSNMGVLNDMTDQILSYYLPIDIWEVRSRQS